MIFIKKFIIIIIAVSCVLAGGYFVFAIIGGGAVTDGKTDHTTQISSLQKGLVGHWSLDEESYNPATKRLTDKTPNENHGTSANAGSFTTDRMGQADRAMTFNGSTDYIDCGSDESLDTTFKGTHDLTITAWVKFPATPATNQLIIEKWGADSGFLFRLNTSRVFFFHLSRDTPIYVYAPSAAAANEWNHLVVTRGGGNTTVYLNAVAGTPIAESQDLLTDDASLNIGQGHYADNFNGSIDEVRIYDRALSEDEISLLYNSYRPKLSAGSLQKGLVLDMPLNSTYTKDVSVEGSEILTDRTPYSNDGTNHGATIGADYTTFNGSTDYIDCGNDESLDITDAITISAWVYMDPDAVGNDNSASTIVSKSNGGTSNKGYILLFLDRDAQHEVKRIRWSGMHATGDNFDVDKDNAIPTAGWYHIVGTYDKDLGGTEEAKLYINGVKEGSVDYSKTIETNAFTVKIGALHKTTAPGYQALLNGSIDEVRIYDRALSGEEIELLYERGR